MEDLDPIQKRENAYLETVFEFAIYPGTHATGEKGELYALRDVAQELADEGLTSALCEATLERALVARLTSPPPSCAQWPFFYLLACHARAQEAQRQSHSLRDAAAAQRLSASLAGAQQLIAAYAALLLTAPDIFPQPAEAQRRGALQVLDALRAGAAPFAAGGGGLEPAAGVGGAGGGAEGRPAQGCPAPLPANFLEELAQRVEEAEMDAVLAVLCAELREELAHVSLLGDFAGPLTMLQRLFASKRLAPRLAALPVFLPASLPPDGRRFEEQTLLGAAFGVSALPDLAFPELPPERLPDAVEACFSDLDARRPAEVREAVRSLQASSASLVSSLHALTLSLLRDAATRPRMLAWLGAALGCNAERMKMHPDLRVSSSDGFVLNLLGVLLRLCAPFLDVHGDKAWGKLLAAYVLDPGARVPHASGETRLAATEAEVVAWGKDLSKGAEGAGGEAAEARGAEATEAGGAKAAEAKGAEQSRDLPPTSYHFMCEAFFMTARCLGLGYVRVLDGLRHLSRRASSYEDAAAELGAQLGLARGEAAPAALRARHPRAVLRLEALLRAARTLKASEGAYQAVLTDPVLLPELLAFLRLLVVFMVRLAQEGDSAGLRGGAAAALGAVTLPLPAPPSREFAALPEYFVEALADVLSLVARSRPELVEQRGMEEFMVFFTVFLQSKAHVKNPYLRSRMIEALHSLMPPPEGEAGYRRMGGELGALLQAHPLVVASLVHSLVQLYVDIEMTDRHNTFYEKFTTRYQIGEVLEYLWDLPQHRAAWRAVADQHAYLYVRFINMMINDAQFLLQEAMETLPRVQEMERAQADPQAWAQRPQQERQELEEQLRQSRGRLKSDFYLASICIKTMQYTADDKDVASLFFNPQVRDREARILNFFLKYLTIPEERKKLKLRDPERYNWHPRQLIAQLASIHVRLFRTDPAMWVEACVADSDYLGGSPSILPECVKVLRSLSLLPEADIAELQMLHDKVGEARKVVAEEEMEFDDVPGEFEDPLLGTIMKDPVKLPSGNILDRATILTHLLTDQRDPFSRLPMTESDIVPEEELKERIQSWMSEQRAAVRQKKMQASAAEDMDAS